MFLALASIIGAFALTQYKARPHIAATSLLSGYVLCPWLAFSTSTSALRVHPVSGFVLALAVLTSVTAAGAPTRRWIYRHPIPSLGFTTLAIAPLASSILRFKLGGAPFAIDMILCPMILFILLLNGIRSDKTRALTVRRFVLFLGVFESLVAIGQKLAGSTLFLQAEYAHNIVYSETFSRAPGTFDQPLCLSLFIVVCIALLPTLRSMLAVAAAAGPLLVALILTQSRIGLVAGLAALCWTIVSLDVGLRIRLLVGTATGVLATLAYSSPLGLIAMTRFFNDAGSAYNRSTASQVFFAYFPQLTSLWGTGIGKSYEDASSMGLLTSFENPLFMYAIDLGLVYTASYFALVVGIIIFVASRQEGVTKTAPALLAVVVCLSFTSLATEMAAAAVLWLALGLSVSLTRPRGWRSHELPSLSSNNAVHV